MSMVDYYKVILDYICMESQSPFFVCYIYMCVCVSIKALNEFNCVKHLHLIYSSNQHLIHPKHDYSKT